MRGMIESLFSPTKKYDRASVAGTRDFPTIVKRPVTIERKYRAWVEEDGSYHEEVITDEDELIINLGGTD